MVLRLVRVSRLHQAHTDAGFCVLRRRESGTMEEQVLLERAKGVLGALYGALRERLDERGHRLLELYEVILVVRPVATGERLPGPETDRETVAQELGEMLGIAEGFLAL